MITLTTAQEDRLLTATYILLYDIGYDNEISIRNGQVVDALLSVINREQLVAYLDKMAKVLDPLEPKSLAHKGLELIILSQESNNDCN